MAHRKLVDRRCSYVVVIDGGWRGDLREFADYLSALGVAKCDVIVVDDSPEHSFARHRDPNGADPFRAALDFALCERVIIAGTTVRYDAGALDEVCALLDYHEAVEPQDYLEPLPWWGGIEAGRMLVHRGIEPLPDRGATFAFRKSAIRGISAVDCVGAPDVFVRRLPPQFAEWLTERPRQAGDDFELPVKSAVFLAVRGRVGARAVFPLRACLYASLWVLERSVSVYWALAASVLRRAAPEDLAPTERQAHMGLTAR